VGASSGWLEHGPAALGYAGGETSAAGAAAIAPIAGRMREAVFDFLASRPFGAADFEIEAALGLEHSTCAARRRELVIAGRVDKSDRRTRSPYGVSVLVWHVVRRRPDLVLEG